MGAGLVPSGEDVQALLEKGKIVSCQPIPSGSNYNFLVRLRAENGILCPAVYKPRRGEAPLWDFPNGTLYRREYTAYLLAGALGWPLIPTTVIREGPYGVGVIQLYVHHQPGSNYFSLLPTYTDALRQICLFDLITNNADRKAGHCLLGTDGQVWSIDHGLTFHALPKLRTVIWDFQGEAISPALLVDLEALLNSLEQHDGLLARLEELLDPREVIALKGRLKVILSQPMFPPPMTSRRNVPWPLV